MKNISLHEPLFKSSEKANIEKCLNTGWLSPSGNFVKDFEKELEKFTNTNVICCNSGTTALHLSLILAGVKNNHEVLVPTVSFIATVNAVLYCNANPVFFDCDKSLCIDVYKISEFLNKNTYRVKQNTYNKKTKRKITAIMITHVFGNLVEMKELKKICKLKNIKIIEDAAESLGSFYLKNNIHSGTIGNYGAISFNVNKIITSGAGGAILFKNKSEKKKIKRLISQGKTNNLLFKHKFLGYNYGMPNVSAAIGSAQFKNIKSILNKKKKISDFYQNFFLKVKDIEIIKSTKYQKQNNWLNVIKIKKVKYLNFKKNIDKLIKEGIDVRPLWYPCHKQEFLKNYETYKVELANKFYKETLCLPSSYFLKKSDLTRVCERILNVFKK